jgi:hypothetical protein
MSAVPAGENANPFIGLADTNENCASTPSA